MKRSVSVVLSCLAVFCGAACLFSSCSGGEKTQKSRLSGKFSGDATYATLFYGGTKEETAQKYVSDAESDRQAYERAKAEAEGAADFAEKYPGGYPAYTGYGFSPYLCSTEYPFSTINGRGILYSYSQTLTLKRDFSYIYTYSIALTAHEDEWGKEVANISLTLNGTFSFEDEGDGENYTVILSDPESGTEAFTAPTVVGEKYISNWTPSVTESFRRDIAYERSLSSDFVYDRYTRGRKVRVDRSEKSLSDDVYFTDIMNDLAPYSDYTCTPSA